MFDNKRFSFKDKSTGRGNHSWVSSSKTEDRNCNSCTFGNIKEGKIRHNFHCASRKKRRGCQERKRWEQY